MCSQFKIFNMYSILHFRRLELCYKFSYFIRNPLQYSQSRNTTDCNNTQNVFKYTFQNVQQLHCNLKLTSLSLIFPFLLCQTRLLHLFDLLSFYKKTTPLFYTDKYFKIIREFPRSALCCTNGSVKNIRT